MIREIKHIVIHCTATPQTTTVKSIQNYWRNNLKWNNPGYHYLIEADGKCHNLQPIDKIANGVRGYNHNSIHLSYIGGVDSQNKPIDNRTLAQQHVMMDIIKMLLKLFPDAKIKGHRDFPNVNKACPSFDVEKWLENYN